MEQSRLIIGTVVGVSILIIVGFGIWNAFQPRIKTMELTINKKVEGMESLNVVAISDTHFGTLVSHRKAGKLMDAINKLKPDLVIIAGDIIDDNIKVVKKHKLLEHFNKLTPKYGVYGIMGNHEYIGKSFTDIPYYENNNIKMLIDSAIRIDDKFYIVGRDDIQARSFYNRDRKSIEAITSDVDFSKPVFLLDHQPYDLQASMTAGIDLQFSGHTHHGQLWPFNYITNRIFEQDWGYLQKGNTHYYVSCGYGTAGPPIRIGSHPEIVNFKINFKEK